MCIRGAEECSRRCGAVRPGARCGGRKRIVSSRGILWALRPRPEIQLIIAKPGQVSRLQPTGSPLSAHFSFGNYDVNNFNEWPKVWCTQGPMCMSTTCIRSVVAPEWPYLTTCEGRYPQSPWPADQGVVQYKGFFHLLTTCLSKNYLFRLDIIIKIVTASFRLEKWQLRNWSERHESMQLDIHAVLPVCCHN